MKANTWDGIAVSKQSRLSVYILSLSSTNLKPKIGILGSRKMQRTNRVISIISEVYASTEGPNFTSVSIRRNHKPDRRKYLNSECKANSKDKQRQKGQNQSDDHLALAATLTPVPLIFIIGS